MLLERNQADGGERGASGATGRRSKRDDSTACRRHTVSRGGAITTGALTVIIGGTVGLKLAPVPHPLCSLQKRLSQPAFSALPATTAWTRSPRQKSISAAITTLTRVFFAAETAIVIEDTTKSTSSQRALSARAGVPRYLAVRAPRPVCYKLAKVTMRLLAVLAVVLMVVLAPALAMAVSNCAGMSADCEGPCGTTTAVSTALVMPSILHLWWSAGLASIPHAPVAPVRLIDLPPRP
jgi:hypothetical protein